MAELRERLAIAVVTGTKISAHCLTDHVGTGSSTHCLLATELSSDATSSSVTGSKSSNGWMGRAVMTGEHAAAVQLRMTSILVLKYVAICRRQ